MNRLCWLNWRSSFVAYVCVFVRAGKGQSKSRGPSPAAAPGRGGEASAPAQHNGTYRLDLRDLDAPGSRERQSWSSPADASHTWCTCHRPLPDYRIYSHNLTLAPSKDCTGAGQAQDRCGRREGTCGIVRSITDMDLPASKVSDSQIWGVWLGCLIEGIELMNCTNRWDSFTAKQQPNPNASTCYLCRFNVL